MTPGGVENVSNNNVDMTLEHLKKIYPDMPEQFLAMQVPGYVDPNADRLKKAFSEYN